MSYTTYTFPILNLLGRLLRAVVCIDGGISDDEIHTVLPCYSVSTPRLLSFKYPSHALMLALFATSDTMKSASLTHRAVESSSSFLSRPPDNNHETNDGVVKISSEEENKSYRRQIPKKATPILYFRRLKYQWALLSGGSKLAATLVLLFLCQHVGLGVWDRLFYKVGGLKEVKPEAYFAVAINTYKRPHMLREAVQHYADSCGRHGGVSQVFVIWAEQNADKIPSPESFFEEPRFRSKVLEENRAKVEVLQKDKDSLNSRFEPIAQLESTAVFMVDDDIRVPCHSLWQGFQAWKTRPDSMVGYYPRLSSPPRSGNSGLIYHTWPVVFWRQSFNFVLTKASFLHSRYLQLYTDDATFPREVKDHIDQHKNCEDIAMSMLVANYTRQQTGSPAPPIYVEGSVSDRGLIGGISTGTGHMTTRSECLTVLTAILKGHGWKAPLDYEVALRPNAWIKHAPGIWWQYRPSNFFEWFAFENTFT